MITCNRPHVIVHLHNPVRNRAEHGVTYAHDRPAGTISILEYGVLTVDDVQLIQLFGHIPDRLTVCIEGNSTINHR